MVKIYGNAGQAVTRVNDPEFTGFKTKSGRTMEDDLARARKPVVSPIQLVGDGKPAPAPEPAAKRMAREAAPAARPPAPARPQAGDGRTKPMTVAEAAAAIDADRAELAAVTASPVLVVEPEVTSAEAVTRTPKARPGPLRNRTRPRQYDHAQLVDAYLRGKSASLVAEQFGCATRTVCDALEEFHVVRRDPYYDTRQQRRLPDPDAGLRSIRADVLAAWEGGARTVSQVAHALGIAWPTANKHLRAAGITPQNGRTVGYSRRPDLTEEVIRQLYVEEDLTCAQVAARLSTTPKTVREKLIRAGVPLRNDRVRNVGHSVPYESSTETDVARLAGAGFAPHEIAVYCRIREPAVHNILGRLGVEITTRDAWRNSSPQTAPNDPSGEYGDDHSAPHDADPAPLPDRPADHGLAVPSVTHQGAEPWPYQI